MALFMTPEQHAANPPASWTVEKGFRRWYLLVPGTGVSLGSYDSRRAAEAAKTGGPLVELYDKERRWYAGERIRGWKPYQPKTPAPAPATAPVPAAPAVPPASSWASLIDAATGG